MSPRPAGAISFVNRAARLRHRAALLVAGALLLGLLSAPGASAYHYGPYRLAKGATRLTYFNLEKSYAWSVAQAAAVWNMSGARVKFVKTSSRRRADVVIGPGTAKSLPRPAVSLIHYSNAGIEILPTKVVITDQTRDKYNMAAIVAHEFGHVLGLAHTKGCALMNPSFLCEGAPSGRWYCRILWSDDVQGVINRYGGSMHLRKQATCPRDDVVPPAPVLSAPTQVTLTEDPGPNSVVLRWTNIGAKGLSTVSIAYKLGACPVHSAAPGQESDEGDAGPAGTLQSRQIGLGGDPAGRYCFVLFSKNADGVEGAASAPVYYENPEQPVR